VTASVSAETLPLALGDFSKLDIRAGEIHYHLYRQDGTLQPMTAPDTLDNRYIISWIQCHDRFTDHDANAVL
jgi:hypothetical protein